MNTDRAIKVKEWQEFSAHMEDYISTQTADKYSTGDTQGQIIDLIGIVSPRFCIENIVKYSLRWLNGFGRDRDIEKIAHYAQIHWTKIKHIKRPEGKDDGKDSKKK